MASINTRSRKVPECPEPKANAVIAPNKRTAEENLQRDNDKRSAFGDLTNAKKAVQAQLGKKDKRTLPKKTETKSRNDSDIKSSQGSTNDDTPFLSALDTSVLKEEPSSPAEILPVAVPADIEDFDKATLSDPYSEANYARDIFEYYRQREAKFKLEKYLDRQPELTKGMRAILTDWLVEVQESFELNHETLYLAVKLVDHYLMRVTVKKNQLQLLGATATFIACKFDERSPPLIDDFLYICDDAYTRHEMIHMEMELIKVLRFDLGIPLSYRFLRRFARCAKVSMEILTLARFVLESSLLEYDLIGEADSKMAAASLLLALKMKKVGQWNSTLEFYSGYKESELNALVVRLNKVISQPVIRTLRTVRVKYSHKVFFEVAKILPLQTAVDV